MRAFATEEIENATALIVSADRDFDDYSRTDLLLDNMSSLRNVEEAHELLSVIGAELRPPQHPR